MSMKEYFSVPNLTLKREPYDGGEKVWSRSLAIRCPFCHDIFYGYQAEGFEREPFKELPFATMERVPMSKLYYRRAYARLTCGDPRCRDYAEAEYNSGDESFQAHQDRLNNPPQEEVPAKKTSGLKHFGDR